MTKILSVFTALILVAGLFFGGVNAQAFGENQTFLIDVEINQNETETVLEYTIFQYFIEESRGVFLSLPKLQDNVWTEYTVENVARAEVQNLCDADDFIQASHRRIQDELVPCLIDAQVEFEAEPWDAITEWNQLRFRVGKPDVILNQGLHAYRFTVQAESEDVSRFEQRILYDWDDELNTVQVTDADGNMLCKDGAVQSCRANGMVEIEINPQAQEAPFWRGVFHQFWIFGVIIVAIVATFYGLWNWVARDPNQILSHTSPRFEPPELFPWQADYLVREGRTQLKDTLLGYLLWLNHTKCTSITPAGVERNGKHNKKAEPTLTINQALPGENETGLPDIFNTTIQKIAKKGFKQGILDSKINPGQHTEKMNNSIATSLKSIYTQGSVHSPVGMTAGVAFIAAFVSVFAFGFARNVLLVGDSIFAIIIFAEIITIPGWYLLFYYWGKLNRNGIKKRDQSHQYRYYIDQAEKLKLDFANNPQTQLQYYLDALPYAANFGLLAQFKKFIANKIPQNIEADGAFASYALVRSATFYTPPNSSSGGFSGGSSGGFSGGGGSW